MKKRLTLLTVCLAIPFLFACAEEDVVIPIESISLDRTSLTLNIGEETTLKATAKPKEAIQEFVWKSADPNAVYVIGGKLHAYSIPTTHDDGGDYTTITVSNFSKNKDEIKTATCKVYVTNIPHDENLKAAGISISENMVELEIGDTCEIFATVSPFGLVNEDKEVKWTSSDTSGSVVSYHVDYQPDSQAATFAEKNSSKVTITALAAGNVVLTAEDNKTGKFKTQCAIKVNPEPEVTHVESIQFSEDELYIEQGKTGQNNLEIIPWAAENKEIEYVSSDENIATVDSNGVVSVKSDAAIGATATITATSVDTPSATDSFTVTVSEHHSNYIFINKVSDPIWKAHEIHLKDGDDSEYHINSIELDVGDEFVFCTGVDEGKETWHHYSQIKSGCEAKDYFGDKGGNIVCNRGGTFEIYVQSDPNDCDWEGEGEGAVMKSIWIIAKDLDPLPDLTMTVVHDGTPGTPEVLGHVGTGANEYGVENRVFNAGDEVIFNYSTLSYGFNEVKDGGASALAKQGHTTSNHIKFEATLTYSIYVDLGNVEYGKRIWIAANYVQKYTNETETWSYADIATNTEPQKENEFVLSNCELNEGDKILFNVANGYYKFADIKPTCPLKDVELIGDDDGNIYIATTGSYTFYVMTPNEYGHEVGIWATATPPVADEAKLLIKDGSPVDLTAKSMTEYDVLAQTVNKDTEFVAKIGDDIYGYEELKTAHEDTSGGVCDLFEEGTAYDASHHYLKAKETLKYDIYVNKTADIWSDHIYISANYMKTCISGTWSVADLVLNDEHEGNTTEFKVTNLTLNKDDKVIFCIGGAWYKYSQMKAAADGNVHLYFASDSDDIKALASGTYTFYIQTSNDDNGIWIIGSLTASKFTYQKYGESETALEFKPGDREEFMVDVQLAASEKIRFNIDGGHSTVKQEGQYEKFSAMDSDGYLTCNTAGKYRFYVKFIGENLGIYIANAPSGTLVNYSISVSNASGHHWFIEDGASIYAWAWGDGVSSKWFKGTVENEATNPIVLFQIPQGYTQAHFVRVVGTITDLDNFSGVNACSQKWNRVDNVTLNGSGGGLNVDFTDQGWHD